MLDCVMLRYKCVFDLGFELGTQSNDDLIYKFIIGWRLVMI